MYYGNVYRPSVDRDIVGRVAERHKRTASLTGYEGLQIVSAYKNAISQVSIMGRYLWNPRGKM